MYSLYMPAHIVLPDSIGAITTEQTLERNIGAGIVIGGLAGREFCNIGTSQLAWINRFSTFCTFPFGNLE